MTVTYSDYSAEKKSFFQKHKHDFRTETSAMDQYGRYHKTYIFSDGAIWYETMSPEYVTVDVAVKLVIVPVEIKMFRTEFWSTDNASSKYYYEKF